MEHTEVPGTGGGGRTIGRYLSSRLGGLGFNRWVVMPNALIVAPDEAYYPIHSAKRVLTRSLNSLRWKSAMSTRLSELKSTNSILKILLISHYTRKINLIIIE